MSISRPLGAIPRILVIVGLVLGTPVGVLAERSAHPTARFAPEGAHNQASVLSDAGYLPLTATQFIAYRSVDSHLRQMHWDQDSMTWPNDRLTEGDASKARGNPFGYFNGTQHIVYRGQDNQIHELASIQNSWQHQVLTSGSPQAAAGNPCAYVYGAAHIVYRGTDGHIHELYREQDAWQHWVMTSGSEEAAAGDPFGYVYGSQHVIYRGTDGQIHDLYWNEDSSSWEHYVLTSGSGEAAAGNPSGYVYGSQHVIYRGTDGQIHELYWNEDTSSWEHQVLTSGSGEAAAGDPSGYVYDSQHVTYRGTDGQVHELYWNADSQSWEHYELTSGGEQAAAGDPFGYVFYLLPPTPTRPLRDLAQARGKQIGAAVTSGPFQGWSAYADTLAREFNLLTPEGEMKFDCLHPARDAFDFGPADAMVEFAENHNMQVRGHTLVWHEGLPSWLTGRSWTRAELTEILRNHITTVVGRYRGRVAAWDVVNEGVTDDGSMRQTIWSQGIGPDYIGLAFRWAHEADPQARLFYNDYGGEGAGAKSDAIYTLVAGLVRQGVPIHGVGMQMHIGLDSLPNMQDVSANMARLGALNLDVHITELDVQIRSGSGTLPEKFIAQANVYSDLLNVCLEQDVCKAFVMWGFTDGSSWIYQFSDAGYPDEAPLIFDPDCRPKPAYYALSYALAAASGGTTSLHLPIIRKTYPPLPAKPVMKAIDNSDRDDAYGVEWWPAERADSYTLQEDDNPGFSSPDTVYQGGGTYCNLVSRPAGTLFYRVQGVNSWGEGVWSDPAGVVIPAPWGVWVIQNDTGGDLKLEVYGYQTNTYSSGRHEWEMPTGTYRYRASAWCGSLEKTLDIPRYGRTGVTRFYCRTFGPTHVLAQ